jgi:H+/Cl- antiporter ClcA
MSTPGARDSGRSTDASAPPAPTSDPVQLVGSREYRLLLAVSAVVGLLVSVACWGFLEVVHALQVGLYRDLPEALGFSSPPWWWPLPILAVAGVLIGLAVTRLPGRGGHEPSEGLHTGAPTRAVELPGVLLAATATVGLGMVLGPEAPLIALGSGLTMLVLDRARRPVPEQGRVVLVAAAAFAALATVFGSPVVGAVIVIEAAALGGPTLPVVLLPGLLASGIGSLAFTGVGSLTGLSTTAYELPPLTLPEYATPQLADFAWVLLLGCAAAVVVQAVLRLAALVRGLVAHRPLVLVPLACLVVGAVAIGFAEVTGESPEAVLFSGQDAMSSVVAQAGTGSLGTLGLLLACKALAWGVSMGAARGGPTFPGIFLGVVGGVLCAHLPGFAETPAVGALVGAAVVSVLRLPLSAIILALLVTGGGAGSTPLVIVAVVVAYLTTLALVSMGRKAGKAGFSRGRTRYPPRPA